MTGIETISNFYLGFYSENFATLLYLVHTRWCSLEIFVEGDGPFEVRELFHSPEVKYGRIK
jgi:hypothetical protein